MMISNLKIKQTKNGKMGLHERSIKVAFNKETREIIDADEIFKNTKESFQIRKEYHEKSFLLSCCECEQDLIVSSSKYDRLYFKYKPGHKYCILSDKTISIEDQEKNIKILISKESDRHKELKNKIGKLLRDINGVDLKSISVDKNFIIKDGVKKET